MKLSESNEGETHNELYYLKKFLEERSLSSFDNSEELRPICIDNKLTVLSSKTLL